MKIVTNIPSIVAQSTDVTDRDIVSHVEIEQSALYPLIPIPDSYIAPGITAPLQRKSWHIDQYGSVTPLGAQIANSICLLGRGLWRLTISGSYFSDYTATTRQAGFYLGLSHATLGKNQALINMIPGGARCVYFAQTFELLLEVDNHSIDFLLAGTGAGQSHQVAVAIFGAKYL